MRARPRSFAIAQIAALAAVAAAPGAGAQSLQQTVASVGDATPVAAWNNVIAWSQRDPTTGRFRLIVARGGSYRSVDVPDRSVPFDVDVGPGPKGGAVVVYSRCTSEPPDPSVLGLSTLPDYTRGRGCRVFAYDVAAEHESALKRNGVLPSIWFERLAYVQGSRLLGSVGRSSGRTLVHGLHGFRPAWTDVFGTHTTALWRHGSRTQLAEGRRLIARASGRERLVGVGWDRGILFFRTTCVGAAGRCPESYWAFRPTSSSYFAASVSANVVAATHASGNTIALLGADNRRALGCSTDKPCRLVIEDQLKFKRASRP